MYNHILVAVDGSDSANLALQEAIKLANEQPGQLRIVHVVDLVTVKWVSEVADLSMIQESLRQSGQEILTKAGAIAHEAAVASETKLLQISTVDQRISDMIAGEANAWPADLIVLGTHGRRGVHRLLLGSVAEGVIRVAAKPVLLIRSV